MKRFKIIRKAIFKQNRYVGITYDVYVGSMFLFFIDYIQDAHNLTEEQLDEYIKCYYTTVGKVKIIVEFEKVNIV